MMRDAKGDGHTIRVSDEVYNRLAELSQRNGLPISKVVGDLVREQERREFFTQLHADAIRLRQDEAAWKEFREEQAEWDAIPLAADEDAE